MKLKLGLFTVLFILSSCGEVENGVDGVDGLNILVKVEEEPAGSNCVDGGKKVSFGYDTNESGVLDVTEVTTSTFICNGEDGQDGEDGNDGQDGQDGQDGEDGTGNVDVQIVQWLSGNTNFYQDDSPSFGDGNVYSIFENPYVDYELLTSGSVQVEISSSMEGPWFQLPYVFYEENTSNVGYFYDGWYSYGVGGIRIDWNCSFGRTLSEWEDISGLYEAYYKITTIIE